jgi:hypothetical protein
MSDKITQLRSSDTDPEHRLELARLNLEQARRAYASALVETGQMSVGDSRLLQESHPQAIQAEQSFEERMAELERQRESASQIARKYPGSRPFSILAY